MTCKKRTSKKYTSRNSPSYSAQDCKGKTMKGKDGIYVSKPDKNNVYRWVKSTKNKTAKAKVKIENIKTPKHKYKIHDNGSTPYIVYDYGNKIDVYYNKYDKDTEKVVLEGKLLEIPYKKIFVGDNELNLKDYLAKGKAKGNTILVENKNGKYTYIGDGIREFSLKDDEIIDLYSPVGNGDVPYPYAVGKQNTYFLLNKTVYVENDKLNLDIDAYSQYYGFIDKEGKNIDNKNKASKDMPSKNLPEKILSKRFKYME